MVGFSFGFSSVTTVEERIVFVRRTRLEVTNCMVVFDQTVVVPVIAISLVAIGGATGVVCGCGCRTTSTSTFTAAATAAAVVTSIAVSFSVVAIAVSVSITVSIATSVAVAVASSVAISVAAAQVSSRSCKRSRVHDVEDTTKQDKEDGEYSNSQHF